MYYQMPMDGQFASQLRYQPYQSFNGNGQHSNGVLPPQVYQFTDRKVAQMIPKAQKVSVRLNGKPKNALRMQSLDKVNDRRGQPTNSDQSTPLISHLQSPRVDLKMIKLGSNVQPAFFNKKQRVSKDNQLLDQYINQLKHIDHVATFKDLSGPQVKQHLYYISDLINALSKEDLHYSQLFREHLTISFNFLPIARALQFDDKEIAQKRVKILQKNNLKYNKTIIFDLDETLVHCNEDESIKSQVYLPIVFPTGEEVNAGLNIRPFAFDIIRKLGDICEVIVFTASHECYANKVIDYIDQDRVLAARMFRDSCVCVDNFYIKNLDVIDRDPKNVVIVDNASYSFASQLDNGIPIVSYYNDEQDNQLIQLYRFLLSHVLPADDVRPVLRNHFKLAYLNDYETPQSAVEHLFI